jgi:deoxyxylulose-5-phosphate synthase
VALRKLPITFVLDRAGVTGPDGASHHGMWDGSLGQLGPELRIAAPRDAARLAELLAEALADSTGPTRLRYPKAPAGDDIPGHGTLGGMDIVAQPGEGMATDVLLVRAGVMAGVCAPCAVPESTPRSSRSASPRNSWPTTPGAAFSNTPDSSAGISPDRSPKRSPAAAARTR